MNFTKNKETKISRLFFFSAAIQNIGGSVFVVPSRKAIGTRKFKNMYCKYVDE